MWMKVILECASMWHGLILLHYRVVSQLTASQQIANKKPSLAPLNNIFSYQMNVALLNLFVFYFRTVLKVVIF